MTAADHQLITDWNETNIRKAMYWLSSASRLLRVAELIGVLVNDAQAVTLKDGRGEIKLSHDQLTLVANDTVMSGVHSMLLGMALECLVKGVQAAQGKRPSQHHKLAELLDDVGISIGTGTTHEDETIEELTRAIQLGRFPTHTPTDKGPIPPAFGWGPLQQAAAERVFERVQTKLKQLEPDLFPDDTSAVAYTRDVNRRRVEAFREILGYKQWIDEEGKMNVEYPVVIEQDSEGRFSVVAPDLAGCSSWGSTRKEAIANIQEAIELWIESARANSDKIPPPGSSLAYVKIDG